MQIFCISDSPFFFRDVIAPSLKAIYKFKAKLQSRTSAANVKFANHQNKKKRQKPLRRFNNYKQ